MISILMATYNGEKYIEEQLESLFTQTNTDFILYIQDDASTDSTWKILNRFYEKYPEKIRLSQLEKNTGNAKFNFLELMARVQDDYIMLCDQDDVWLPTKIEETLAKMKEMETEYPNQPIIVHTDLTVVDKDLNIISPSFKYAMESDFTRNAFPQLLIQNILTGCTCMYNRRLSEYLVRKPNYCIMHDWWLMLIASAFGKIGHIDKPTILYRQHGENSVGAQNFRTLAYVLERVRKGNEIKKAILITFSQAESILEVFNDLLPDKYKQMARQYCAIPKMNKLKRWHTVYTMKALKIGIVRNIAYFLYI